MTDNLEVKFVEEPTTYNIMITCEWTNTTSGKRHFAKKMLGYVGYSPKTDIIEDTLVKQWLGLSDSCNDIRVSAHIDHSRKKLPFYHKNCTSLKQLFQAEVTRMGEFKYQFSKLKNSVDWLVDKYLGSVEGMDAFAMEVKNNGGNMADDLIHVLLSLRGIALSDSAFKQMTDYDLRKSIQDVAVDKK